MSLVVRTRIDHRNLPSAKDVCACAVKGKGSGIVGNHPTNAWRNMRNGSVAEFQLAAIGNVYHMWCLNYLCLAPFRLVGLAPPEYRIGLA